MAAQVQDVDKGYQKLVERVFAAALRKPVVTIGIHASEGSASHGDAIGAALTVLQIGIFNEFGTASIPERSFIRAWFDENEASIRKDLTILMRTVIEGKRASDQVLEILGQRAVGQIQERIASGIAPANAPSTVAKKGSSTPLIDTGVLRSSITYQVKP